MDRPKRRQADLRIVNGERPRCCAATTEDTNRTGIIMSHLHSVEPSRLRNRILASAAVLSLVAAGAVGEGALTAPHPARAATVVTSDLQGQSMPSFAPLIARVKPAVVSVKVRIVHQSDRELPPERLDRRPDNLPPESSRSSGSSASRTAPPRIQTP